MELLRAIRIAWRAEMWRLGAGYRVFGRCGVEKVGEFASGSCRPIAVNRWYDVGGGEAAIVGKDSFGLSRYRLGAVSYIPCDVCTSQGYARRGCSRTDHRHSREGCCSA